LHSEETKGKKVKNLCGHGNDVTQLKIDYQNKLLISGGCDSTINIQTLNDNNVELKRTIHHTHNDKVHMHFQLKKTIKQRESTRGIILRVIC
jgi:WD40 repeat protein